MSRWGRRGSSARSTRAPRSRESWADCRSSPTGSRRAARIRSSSASGRSTGCWSRTKEHGPRFSTWFASGCSRMGWRCRRKDGSDGRDRGEEAQAGNALLGRTHGRERRLLERAVGPEADRLLPAALDKRDEDPLRQLALAERHAEVPLDDLERLLRRGEERLAQALSE